jgi:energy-coupling factor transporter ATP-binding protein EcfA2
MPAMVEVSDLTVSYGKNPALRDLSFCVEEGDFVLISGPSGCGKSTLALALTGLIPHAKRALMKGAVLVDGIDTRTGAPAALASHIGIVFQNPQSQLFHSTVEDEVCFAPRNSMISGEPLGEDDVKRRAVKALASTGILHLQERKTGELSDGERQRVAIASVLSMEPRVLVLDEPTANLDWEGTRLVMEALSRLNREKGITVLVIEHRVSAVYPRCSKAMIITEGEIAAFGDRKSVFLDRKRLVRLGLRFPWKWIERGTERYVPEGIRPPKVTEAPLVELKGVSAGYGKNTVFSDIDLSLYPGEFVALVGKNGTGKSTLARIIAGLHRPSKGKVIWHPSVRRLPIGRRVGFMFQNTGEQLLCRTVEDEVSLGPECLGLEKDAYKEALETADLVSLRERAPFSLSIGERQRCVLASVLASDPVLFILDEPSVGQDWGHLSRVMAFLKRLAENGKVILLITHDDKLVCRFAERIVLLEGGRITADGIPDRRETALGMEAVF